MSTNARTTAELLAAAAMAACAADRHAGHTRRPALFGPSKARRAHLEAVDLHQRARLLVEMEEIMASRPETVIAGHLGHLREAVTRGMTHCLRSGRPRTACRSCAHPAAQIAALTA